MAVKIKLKRMGKIRNPQYRIIVADARTKRDGRAIEQIGKYHPKEDPSLIDVDSARAQYWLGVGAQPTEPVLALLKVTGDWQKFKGLPGAEGTLKVKEAARDKRERFDLALSEAHGESRPEATKPKKRTRKATTVEKAAATVGDSASEPEPQPDSAAGEKHSDSVRDKAAARAGDKAVDKADKAGDKAADKASKAGDKAADKASKAGGKAADKASKAGGKAADKASKAGEPGAEG